MTSRSDRRILAVVPARGGSVRLPDKNIRPFAGKPLLAHTILAAQAAGSAISRVIVSTDDEAIAQVARDCGAEVPFRRPAELATAEAASLAAVQHAVAHVEGEERASYGWVLLLQPTSPLRTAEDIRAAIDLAAGEATAVVSVTEAHDAHPAYLRRIEDGWLRPLDPPPSADLRRQDLRGVYRLNGAIYLACRDVVMTENSLHGARPRAYVMPRERSIDIDDEFDFMVAELIFRQRSSREFACRR